MKRVVDAGALRSPKLEGFLSASSVNFAVLTDYASMESRKGAGGVNVRKSLEIVARFPKQVIVLKSTDEICRLRPRAAGLHGRFADDQQMRGFPAYCRALLSDAADPDDVAHDIRSKEVRAREHFERLGASAEEVRVGIATLAKSYTPADLKALRSRQPISEPFSNRIIRDVLCVTALHFRDSFGFTELPNAADARYSFPFRYAMCSYALSLKWIADGGYESVSKEKLRNDFTDMTYAAYATFYDGLITNDRKLHEIWVLARWMLAEVFA